MRFEPLGHLKIFLYEKEEIKRFNSFKCMCSRPFSLFRGLGSCDARFSAHFLIYSCFHTETISAAYDIGHFLNSFKKSIKKT